MKLQSIVRPIFFNLLVLICLASGVPLSAQQLPVYQSKKDPKSMGDWLINPSKYKAEIFTSPDEKKIIFSNGLVKREFIISPTVACVDFVNLTTGQQLLRTVREEARLNINGQQYFVGGLKGLNEKAYLDYSWLENATSLSNDFKYKSYRIDGVKSELPLKTDFWKTAKRYGSGKIISFLYESNIAALPGLKINVNYELFDGMPLIVKSVVLRNAGKQTVKLDTVVNEVLSMVEEESAVAGGFNLFRKPQGIYFETNYAFNNSMRYIQSDQTTHWKADTTYKTQVNYEYQTPALVEVYPKNAPGVELKPGQIFNSVRTHELLMDNYDRERRGLSVRKMYRSIIPWATANPIFMHLVSENDDEVRLAIDQCAAVGYEALIISFGSHLNMEDTCDTNIKRWRDIADYAHRKNIRIGCYSLFSSRSISAKDDIIDPKTGKPGGAFFGKAPCFGSAWGLWYTNNIKSFFIKTSFDIWENDGPYAGDICGSTTHPGHVNKDDSQWKQMNIQKELYHWLNEKGIYINSPDWYFLDGTNKIALGYRETNFQLAREQQMILNRQNIFDGTWDKIPAMSWGIVPLTEYAGGGPKATIEPLSEHLADYEQLMMQYYGAGIQACYRGPRLYDTEETKQLVIKVVEWYKKYRAILNADIIHLRRADGRDWDGILHVNPDLIQKGLIMLYNPLKEKVTHTIKIPLYYTGLTHLAKIREKEGKAKSYKLNRDFTVDFTFTLSPEAYSWFVVE